MEVKFTEEQKAVIDARKSNILVSAAAGSGKTAVLVERIIKLIEEGTDVDHLLVVTFTKAAASQMKEKIIDAIRKKLMRDPDNAHMQRQETIIHNAQITTIDSFCQYIIRNNFNTIGLDPSFRVADEGELKLLKQEVMSELLEEEYEKAINEDDSDFIYCMNYFGTGSRDDKAEEYIEQLFDFSMSMPWPEDWLKDRAFDYDIDGKEFDDLYWVRECVTYAKRLLNECHSKMEDAIKIASEPDGPYMYIDLLKAEKNSIAASLDNSSYDELFDGVRGISFGRLSSKKDESVNADKRQFVRDLRDGVKKTVNGLIEEYFALTSKTIIAQMKLCDRAVRELTHLAIAYKKKFDDKKRERRIIDFSDMEHFALDILVEHPKEEECEGKTADEIIKKCSASPVALEYRDYYKEVLIDEYQDSNNVQELILGAIAGDEPGISERFMVGDVKQSIYKFRLARPEIFMEKLRTYDKDKTARDRRIDLHKNFRSRKEVLAPTNYIFSKLMGEDLGGVAYDEDARLVVGADFEDPSFDVTAEFIMLDGSRCLSDDENDKTIAELTNREKEALAVAERIHELRKENPLILFKDIVILLRSLSGWDDVFKKVLDSQQIPSYIESKSGYFEAPEVSVLLNLLSIIDNPRQDIPLVSVMHSCIGEFSDEELSLIRIAINGNEELIASESFYDGLLGELSLDSKLLKKIKAFVDMIEQFRKMSAYTPVHELLQYAITKTDYDHKVTAMPAGSQRKANVDMLLERAVNFERTSYKGLFHFVRYIEQLKIVQADYGEAGIVDENADVVRIMSIHKSKGLEFPVVFVSGLSKEFNRLDTRGDLITDLDLGLGVRCIDTKLRVRYDTLKRHIIADKMKMDSLGEEIRVLYVALTRAKEKLILTSFSKDLSKDLLAYIGQLSLISSCGELLPYSMRAGAQNYFSMVLGSLIRHPNLRKVIEMYGLSTDEFDRYKEDEKNVPAIRFTVLGEEELKAGYILSAAKALLREEDLKSAITRAVEAGQSEKPVEDIYDGKMYERLKSVFSRKYTHEDLKGLYTKTTVSELKRARLEEVMEPSYREADFAEAIEAEEEVVIYSVSEDGELLLSENTEDIDKKEDVTVSKEQEKKAGCISGAERGTAYHRFMELLDEKIYGDTGLMEEARIAYEAGKDTKEMKKVSGMIYRWGKTKVADMLMTQEQLNAVYTRDVVSFLGGSLGQRMSRAFRDGKLYREKPFMMGISANELDDSFPEEEMVLVQGIIDAWFVEGDEIILLDYKTDRVDSPNELVDRYSVQLSLYKRALEAATGKKVRDVYIYSFRLGEIIPLKE